MITDFIQKELARDLNGHDHALRASDYLLLALNLGDNSLAVSCYEAMRSESWVGYEHKMDYHGDGVRSHGQLADDKPVDDPQPADESEFEEEDGLPIQYLSDRPPQRLTENNPLTQEINGPFGDLGAMPLNWFLRLSPTIAWIILRANIHEELGLGSGKAKFKELLNWACESSSSDTWQTAADVRSTSSNFQVHQVEPSRD